MNDPTQGSESIDLYEFSSQRGRRFFFRGARCLKMPSRATFVAIIIITLHMQSNFMPLKVCNEPAEPRTTYHAWGGDGCVAYTRFYYSPSGLLLFSVSFASSSFRGAYCCEQKSAIIVIGRRESFDRRVRVPPGSPGVP